jgi:hypothetical protein
MTTVLDREMYTEAGAARLLRVAPATLHYWLEGGTRRNKNYKPVIRDVATGSKSVTWAEFVEAGLLRQYRRQHNVPMGELRSFIDRLRDRMGLPYPLAHYRPYVGNRQLIFEAQSEAKLGPEFALVAEVSGQYVLTSPSQEFFERVTWEGDIAARLRAGANAHTPVTNHHQVR